MIPALDVEPVPRDVPTIAKKFVAVFAKIPVGTAVKILMWARYLELGKLH
jgi:hypothetical protein